MAEHGTIAYVQALPPCYFHPDREAHFDGKTTVGPWAYMCDDCMDQRGIGLGVGRGQNLVIGKPPATDE